MKYRVKVKDEEIDKVLLKTMEQIDNGSSRWPGMSYEEGVQAAIDWITGGVEDNPMEEEGEYIKL